MMLVYSQVSIMHQRTKVKLSGKTSLHQVQEDILATTQETQSPISLLNSGRAHRYAQLY